NRQLYATLYYATKVIVVVKDITDLDLTKRAIMIRDIRTFIIDAIIKGVLYKHIIGLVIYNLLGRDYSRDASSREYKTRELARYKANSLRDFSRESKYYYYSSNRA
ncbi:hypothetical protein D6D18_10561, partial [Aureobasidium pullulans]